jgi:hypothetical protein
MAAAIVINLQPRPPSLGSRDVLDENDGLLGKELLEWWNWKVIAVLYELKLTSPGYHGRIASLDNPKSADARHLLFRS